ncbi:MAG: CDP-archaeol synthase [Acutalibacteraceae bacterium]|nr:CDP-archaeol synthase [Acutalibacteraceae bacterium]
MKARILSAIVGVPLVILAFVLHRYFPMCLNIVASLASLICTIEVLTAKGLNKNKKISIPCALVSVLMPIVFYWDLQYLILFAFVFYIFSLLIIKNNEFTFVDMAFVLTTILLISIGMSCVAMSTMLDPVKSCYYAVLCIGIPWLSDGGAYFVGVSLGKHKLCPSISPKKTIEGAIGGVIVGILGGVVCSLVYDFLIFDANVSINYIAVIILSAIGTATSMVGDLTFSLIKRSCDVKDYGNVIPGHGGILDRCDSVIMTAPLIYVFIMYLPLVTV